MNDEELGQIDGRAKASGRRTGYSNGEGWDAIADRASLLAEVRRLREMLVGSEDRAVKAERVAVLLDEERARLRERLEEMESRAVSAAKIACDATERAAKLEAERAEERAHPLVAFRPRHVTFTGIEFEPCQKCGGRIGLDAMHRVRCSGCDLSYSPPEP